MKKKSRHIPFLSILLMAATLTLATAVSATAATSCTSCSVSLNPGHGVGGSSVAVTGAGFSASTTVDITFKDHAGVKTSLVSGVPVGGTGAFSTTVTVPLSAALGSGRIIAFDPTSLQTAGATFYVWCASTPAISLSPTSGLPNSSVKVTGSTYCANAAVKITFISSTKVKTTLLPSVTAGSTGSFSVTVTIPSTAPVGSSRISGVDLLTHQAAAASFKVT